MEKLYKIVSQIIIKFYIKSPSKLLYLILVTLAAMEVN